MTQKRRTGKYPFNRGRNTGRRTVEGQTSPEFDDEEIVNIVEVKEQAQDFIEKNQKVILGALVGLVLLVGGYLVWKYMIIGPKEEAAVEAMRQAQTQFARDSFNLALTQPGGGSEGFLDIIENYSGTNSANTAKYYAGISYLHLGKYQEAIDYLESYSPKDDITPAMTIGAIGDCYAELGDLDKALSKYEKAASQADNDFIGAYYLNKAALLKIKQGNNDGALASFKSLLEKYPDAPEAKNAEKFIAKLN